MEKYKSIKKNIKKKVYIIDLIKSLYKILTHINY